MVTKTGGMVKDKLTLVNKDDTATFKIHFPTHSPDCEVLGKDIEISLETLKELQTKLNENDFITVKKEGKDKLLITNENVLGVYKIYFPTISLDSEVTGTTVELSTEDYKLLGEKVNHLIYWLCPRCSHGLHNYRRSELDWDYLRCSYCGWNEKDDER